MTIYRFTDEELQKIANGWNLCQQMEHETYEATQSENGDVLITFSNYSDVKFHSGGVIFHSGGVRNMPIAEALTYLLVEYMADFAESQTEIEIASHVLDIITIVYGDYRVEVKP